MQFTVILSLIFAIFIALFAVLNSGVVAINLFFSKFETSLAIVILASAALGAVVIYLFGVINKFKSSRKIKELEKKVILLEKNLEEFNKEKINSDKINVSDLPNPEEKDDKSDFGE